MEARAKGHDVRNVQRRETEAETVQQPGDATFAYFASDQTNKTRVSKNRPSKKSIASRSAGLKHANNQVVFMNIAIEMPIVTDNPAGFPTNSRLYK